LVRATSHANCAFIRNIRERKIMKTLLRPVELLGYAIIVATVMVGALLPPSPRMLPTFWLGVFVAMLWWFGTAWFKNTGRR
jgi:hypothetical protein